MANSTLLTDYLGKGIASSRPSSVTVAAGALALWFSTDTGELDYYNGSGWTSVGSLPSIGSHDLLANITGSSAAPTGVTLSALIDVALGNTQGDIIYRGSSAWGVLAPGTSGDVLTTGGSGANPAWGAAGGAGTLAGLTDVTLTSPASGQFLQYNGTDWINHALALADMPTSLKKMPLPFSFSDKPGDGQMIHFALIDDVPITIPSGFTGTKSYVGTNPASTAVFTLYYVRSGSPTSIGTLSISTGGTVTLTSSSGYTSSSGDTLRMTAPSPQDATLADVCLTVEAARA